jgi:hypothetical protein
MILIPLVDTIAQEVKPRNVNHGCAVEVHMETVLIQTEERAVFQT